MASDGSCGLTQVRELGQTVGKLPTDSVGHPEENAPVFSCSQHRYSPGFIGMKSHEEVGDVIGCDVYGGCPREPHHPDLVWHGIHGIETLYTIMGPGCVSVTRASTDTADVVIGI